MSHRVVHFLVQSALLLSMNFPVPAQAPEASSNPLGVRPRDRVSRLINEDRRAVLAGNRHPFAQTKYDRGPVPGSFRLNRMILTLKPDKEQQQALDSLVDAQHDPDSPYYHQWLTPESYGQMFGISDNDLAQLTNWLQQHGMTVDEITPGRRSIIFSGSAAQLNSTFRTQIHTYRIDNELHHANASDPEIPEALAGVVGGVVSLHDFRSSPLNRLLNRPSPAFSNAGGHYMAPADFATIYDLGPLYQQSVNGAGQSVAIVGRINLNLSDIRLFRSSFGLPANDPQIVVNGTNPGIYDSGEEVEAVLDVEWSGAVAKNAAIKFVVSASTNSSDGVYLSAQYIVNRNLAPVMSVSFGLCEAAMGASGNSFVNSLWQQAAAQGITVLVSSGDSGAAGCDGSSATAGTHGRGVNGLCSTPYSVCVGGTQFDDSANPTLYWSSSNTPGAQASALSYIPEKVWNESGVSGLWASGGGVSAIYNKPSWQSGTGVPADGHRDVPDVSLTAAGHDGYLIYMNGSLGAVGGTSAASPAFAGLMALVAQSTGVRQGNANAKLYTLATRQQSNGAAIFHDILSGTNSVPGVTGYSAAPGYDLASGLGSVDAHMLVTHWEDTTTVPGFTFTGSASFLALPAGGSNTITVTSAVSGAFSAPVDLSVRGLPVGVAVALTPSTFLEPGSGTSTLRLTASSSARAGSSVATAVATSGGTTKTFPLTVNISLSSDFTLSASSTSLTMRPASTTSMVLRTAANSSFSAPVNLTIASLPAGVTASFSRTTIPSPGSGSSTLTFSASAGAAPGTYRPVITASGNSIVRTTSLQLNVPGFTLACTDASVALAPGGRRVVSLATRALGGFNAAVSFSIAGLPAGVAASFTPSQVGAPGNGTTTLTLTRGSSAREAVSVLTLSAAAGGIKKTVPLRLDVTSK